MSERRFPRDSGSSRSPRGVDVDRVQRGWFVCYGFGTAIKFIVVTVAVPDMPPLVRGW